MSDTPSPSPAPTPPSRAVAEMAERLHRSQHPGADPGTLAPLGRCIDHDDPNDFTALAVAALAAHDGLTPRRARRRAPVEAKVRQGAIGAGVVGTLVAALLAGVQAMQAQVPAMAGLPGWLAPALTVGAAVLGSLAAGYAAPHTPRPDLAADLRVSA